MFEIIKSDAFEFKSPELAAATETIRKAATSATTCLLAIGHELKRIRDNALFAEDFTENGKPSFAAYCETVLGISKSKAYRYIAIVDKILEKDAEGRFLGFSDTALSVVSENGKNYGECVDFCNRNGITEVSTVAEIREAAKAEKIGGEAEGDEAEGGEAEGGETTPEYPAWIVSAAEALDANLPVFRDMIDKSDIKIFEKFIKNILG